MRESRAPVPRTPPILLATPTRAPDVLELAGIVIGVDGESIRLGDYWLAVRMQAAAARRERGL